MLSRNVAQFAVFLSVLILSLALMHGGVRAQDGPDNEAYEKPVPHVSDGNGLLDNSATKLFGSLFGGKEAGTVTQITSPRSGPTIQQAIEEPDISYGTSDIEFPNWDN